MFLQPPWDYPRGLVQPVLPNDFDFLGKEDRVTALHAYEVSTFWENRLAHNVVNMLRVFWELFIRIGKTSGVRVVPLRECLIEIFRNWRNLGIAGHCPYSFRCIHLINPNELFSIKSTPVPAYPPANVLNISIANSCASIRIAGCEIFCGFSTESTMDSSPN